MLQSAQEEVTTGNDSDEEETFVNTENVHMSALEYKYESSIYSSDSEESVSDRLSPPLDDANRKRFDQFSCFKIFIKKMFISGFLTEVIDSLERGFKEKSNPDFLILEINSSRYAYNITLSEVNFYVVKAMLNLYPIKESNGNVLSAFNQIFAHLNSVLKNYIRGTDAMSDCLKAIEVSRFIYGDISYLQSHRKID